jgi:hypothetical protein
MRKRLIVAAGCGLLGLAGAASLPAQTLDMTHPPASAEAAGTPGRGMSMAQVEQKFGAPAERVPAVGHPPITRWVYPGFVVYFEYDHVVHAVATQAK